MLSGRPAGIIRCHVVVIAHGVVVLWACGHGLPNRVLAPLESMIDQLNQIDQLQSKVDKMDVKLTKHIKFTDRTYEGLKSPIKTVTGFFGKKYE